MASSSSSSPPGEANETRNWVDLPRDVTAMILQRLGAVDILQSAQKVCMTWRSICKDPAMWRSIDLRDVWSMDFDQEKMAKHAIDLSCGQLLDLNVEYFATDELLQYISERASQLRHLRLVCCHKITDEGMIEAAKKLPLLEELHIYVSLSKEALETVGRCCPQLKSLRYNNHATRGPQMECDEEALAIAETMPGLRDLQLFGNKMTNNGLQAILNGCPHLESLDVRQCFNVNLEDALRKRLSERIKYLRSPDNSTDDCGFEGHDYDSFDDEYPSGFSEIDIMSDVDEYYEFSGGSDLSDYSEPYFGD